jgi:hypothetical protein
MGARNASNVRPSRLTLVQSIFVLLALLAASGHAVQLVHEATAAAAGLLLLIVSGGLLTLGLVTAGELVDEIHCD